MNHLKERYNDVSFGMASIIIPRTLKGELIIVPTTSRFGLENFNRGPYEIASNKDIQPLNSLEENPILEYSIKNLNPEKFKLIKARQDSFNLSFNGLLYSFSDSLKNEAELFGGEILRFASSKPLKINPAVWGHYMVDSVEGEGATRHCGITGRIGRYSPHI